MKIKAGVKNTLRKQGLAAAIGEQFGENLFTEDDDVPDWISTGSGELDDICNGGIPAGRITEIFSPEESHGKSTLAASIIKNAQQQGYICVLLDSEQSFLPKYWKRLGVDVDALVAITDSFTLEQAFEIIDFTISTLKKGEKVLIILDSVAATLTNRELKGDYDKEHYASQARVLSPALRKVAPLIKRKGAALVMINQSRMKVGILFGNPIQTPGGKALKYWCHLRISLKRKAFRKKPKVSKPIGIDVEAAVVKSKIGPPSGTAQFKIIFGKGVYDMATKVPTKKKKKRVAK